MAAGAESSAVANAPLSSRNRRPSVTSADQRYTSAPRDTDRRVEITLPPLLDPDCAGPVDSARGGWCHDGSGNSKPHGVSGDTGQTQAIQHGFGLGSGLGLQFWAVLNLAHCIENQ